MFKDQRRVKRETVKWVRHHQKLLLAQDLVWNYFVSDKCLISMAEACRYSIDVDSYVGPYVGLSNASPQEKKLFIELFYLMVEEMNFMRDSLWDLAKFSYDVAYLLSTHRRVVTPRRRLLKTISHLDKKLEPRPHLVLSRSKRKKMSTSVSENRKRFIDLSTLLSHTEFVIEEVSGTMEKSRQSVSKLFKDLGSYGQSYVDTRIMRYKYSDCVKPFDVTNGAETLEVEETFNRIMKRLKASKKYLLYINTALGVWHERN